MKFLSKWILMLTCEFWIFHLLPICSWKLKIFRTRSLNLFKYVYLRCQNQICCKNSILHNFLLFFHLISNMHYTIMLLFVKTKSLILITFLTIKFIFLEQYEHITWLHLVQHSYFNRKSKLLQFHFACMHSSMSTCST